MRIGVKQQATRSDGSTYQRPASVDYFHCDTDPIFAETVGEHQPKTLQITFPYRTVDECFPSGLEKWGKTKAQKPILLCYTKGDGTAHGLGASIEGERHVKLDPSKPRQSIPCPAHDCNFYGKGPAQGCRPQARLNFLLPGGPRDGVYRIDTKGLDTIQGITGVLQQYDDLRGLVFELSISTAKKGNKQYPIIHIREVSGVPGGDSPGPASSKTVAPVAAAGSEAQEGGEPDVRRRLAATLQALGEWPPAPATVAWIKDVGLEAALDAKQAALKERS